MAGLIFGSMDYKAETKRRRRIYWGSVVVTPKN